jgi:sec-independent protein translocase protein TatA
MPATRDVCAHRKVLSRQQPGGQRMPTLGPLELGVILVIVIIIFGAGKLPELGGSLGKTFRDFKNATREVDDLKQTISLKNEVSEIKQSISLNPMATPPRRPAPPAPQAAAPAAPAAPPATPPAAQPASPSGSASADSADKPPES